MIKRFESFVTGITVCYKYIQRIKSAEMTEFGLKGTHVMCLFFLHHNPEGLTAAQLCQLCAEDKAAVSRTVSELQKEGYIASGEKKYRAILRLTEKGEETAKRVDSLIEQWVGFGGAGLSDEDRAAFYRALELISNNLRRSAESAPNNITI
ncbi:MAG: MarR family winged helix-turn-helix transcriptional regulator [Oscillospiraceae bacterium]